MKKLSIWAKENNLKYTTAYEQYKAGTLNASVVKKGNHLYVKDPILKEENKITPKLYSFASSDDTSRRNRAATINRTDMFVNIEKGVIPFNLSAYGNSTNSLISIRDAIVLCQKCYYNFASFRNIIDLMTEFAVSDIFFRGGNDKSKEFFKALFNKLDLWELQDRFYREYFRSGNVFIYRMDSILSSQEVSKITQVYGNQNVNIPIKYIILNPADIQSHATVSYIDSAYAKVLSPYEIERLKNPKTNEEIEIYNSLPKETKEQIKKGESVIYLPLDNTKIHAIFYKKQDYEPMAVPLGFPVLKDINWKEELKNIDMAIARTIQQVVLLITVGSELKDGTLNISQTQIDRIQQMFSQETVGRVFVSDYTTKMEFIIPEIDKILDPKKYQIVNEDIRLGLNNILVGEDKFANQHIKVQVFIERLRHARMAFRSQFLIPEIKRISKELGFKVFPTPYFTGFSLDDKAEWAKIYTRLAELGLLSPNETINAIEDGRLPDEDESIQAQTKYKSHKDKELYQPLIGGGQKKEEGRPAGSTSKKPKKVTPIGGSEKYSINKLKEVAAAFSSLEKEIEQKFKEKNKIKKIDLNHKSLIEKLSLIIAQDQPVSNWINSIEEYLKNPIIKNNNIEEIEQLSIEHNIDLSAATLMYHSKI